MQALQNPSLTVQLKKINIIVLHYTEKTLYDIDVACPTVIGAACPMKQESVPYQKGDVRPSVVAGACFCLTYVPFSACHLCVAL